MSAPPAFAERDLRGRDGTHRLRRLRPRPRRRSPARASGPPDPFGIFAFSAPGLVAPTVTPVIDPNTFVFQAMPVSANPGVPSDANISFLGFGLGFGQPACLDASAFNAIQFTVTGDLGTCQLGVTLTPSQNNSVANGPFGVCPTPGGCFGPFSPAAHERRRHRALHGHDRGRAAGDAGSDGAERHRLEPDRAQRRCERSLRGELHRQRRGVGDRAVAPRDRAAPSPRAALGQAGLDGRSSLRV